jgi:hypothetical protein
MNIVERHKKTFSRPYLPFFSYSYKVFVVKSIRNIVDPTIILEQKLLNELSRKDLDRTPLNIIHVGTEASHSYSYWILSVNI